MCLCRQGRSCSFGPPWHHRALVRYLGNACHERERTLGPCSPAKRALLSPGLYFSFPPLPSPVQQIHHSRCPSVGDAQHQIVTLAELCVTRALALGTSPKSPPSVMCWSKLHSWPRGEECNPSSAFSGWTLVMHSPG